MSTIKAIALYSFQPSAPVELALQKGDIVTVRNTDAGEGWCEGELHGKRGLFPKTYVKMLEDENETTDSTKLPSLSNPTAPPLAVSQLSSQYPPLTPQSNKKMFMETLLTPTPNTIDKVFDGERAAEIFAHTEIQISAGPRWSHKPPTLTITINDGRKQTRSSGLRVHKFYEVITKELKVTVQRKYKQFLWLYDQLAEKFPCVSLPPVPIKQGLSTGSEAEFFENRRRGLERFLNRVARHPILGCTKLLHVFLVATDDKEWRIGTGKHTSIIKTSGSKGSKKLFAAPIYHTVHYPPYNVPLNQLASFDKFSKFSELLEANVSGVTRGCEKLKVSHGQMARSYRSLGKDLQSLAKGSVIGRHLRKSVHGAAVSLPNSQPSSSLHSIVQLNEESESEEETDQDDVGSWNWREDEKFSKLTTQLFELGTKMKQIALQHIHHQEMLEHGVIESLDEYSGIIHTLPVLVKLHEEAMSLYNEVKQKGSKQEAEDVRQDCETLNNIVLSEFDYFSDVMIEDFQSIILTLLKNQAEYHKKLAAEWEDMYNTFSDERPIRRTTLKRSITNPGSKSNNGSHLFSVNQQRPASSDEKKPKEPEIPPHVPRPYANLETVPLEKVNGVLEENMYANVISHSKTVEKKKVPNNDSVYENWKPNKTSSVSSPTNNESPPPTSGSPSAPVPNKPIPPPLILRRHELTTNQEEAEAQGRETDSFIVPNLHYSQVSVMGPLNEIEQVLEPAVIQQQAQPHPTTEPAVIQQQPQPYPTTEPAVIQQQPQPYPTTEPAVIQQQAQPYPTTEPMSPTISNGSPKHSKKPLPPPRGQSMSTVKKVPQLSDSFSDSSEEVDKKEGQKIVEASKLEQEQSTSNPVPEEKVVTLKSGSTYSPQMHTKLAKMTQLPSTPTNPTSPLRKPCPSKSFTQKSETPVPKPTLNRTLPRGIKPPNSKNSDDNGSELFKKLQERRQRLDRQLSNDTLPLETSSLTGTDNHSSATSTGEEALRSNKNTNEKDSNNLAKFGIIEEGGTFEV